MGEKLKIGISRCLLGDKVRWDGGHKHDRYLTDTLGQFVQFVPVCPEVEAGYRQKNPSLNYAGVDEVERFQVSPTQLAAFIKEGGLTP